MSAFKQFNLGDVLITPFETSKTYSLSYSQSLDEGIEFYAGEKLLPPTYDFTELNTGINYKLNKNLVYSNISQLYYNSSSFAETFQQSSYFVERILESTASVISIPMLLYGENIMPYTFTLDYDSYTLSDDGKGNIIDSDEDIIGQIFYSQGIVVLTKRPHSNLSNELSSSVISDITLGFASNYTIREYQYKCEIGSNEFNYSLNPSLRSGSTVDVYKDFVSQPYFNPYMTTIGLYNDKGDLLVVAKLSKPIPISKYFDTSILINFDI